MDRAPSSTSSRKTPQWAGASTGPWHPPGPPATLRRVAKRGKTTAGKGAAAPASGASVGADGAEHGPGREPAAGPGADGSAWPDATPAFRAGGLAVLGLGALSALLFFLA